MSSIYQEWKKNLDSETKDQTDFSDFVGVFPAEFDDTVEIIFLNDFYLVQINETVCIGGTYGTHISLQQQSDNPRVIQLLHALSRSIKTPFALKAVEYSFTLELPGDESENIVRVLRTVTEIFNRHLPFTKGKGVNPGLIHNKEGNVYRLRTLNGSVSLR